MYSQVKGNKKNALTLAFLIVGICISFATGVITAFMSDNGCSPAFIAVAIFSFLYLVVNVLLIFYAKAWERLATWIIFILLIGILIVTLIGLGYSAEQSICQINICGRSYQKYNDDFWNSSIVSNYKSQVNCDYINNDSLANAFVLAMGVQNQVNPGSSFYIRRGWPISFTVLQFILILVQIVLTFLKLYSCSGCKPSPVNKGISY
ncbi:hypothetical protein ABPG73_004774 [Tetrahymena malaccensis]